MILWRLCMSSFCVVALSMSGVLAQVTSPIAGVPALHGEAAAYSRQTDRLFVVGGRTPDGPLEGTWMWDAQGWRLLVPAAQSPPHRAGHAMAVWTDARIFLFGGMSGNPARLLCDTWVFDQTSWREVGPPQCLDGRVRNASLVYDSSRKTMLLVSGPAVATEEPRATEIWRWDAERWVLTNATGPRRVGFGATAFDEARGVLVVPVLYGGPDEGTWEWNGTSWRKVTSAVPGRRQTYSLTFDTVRRKVVLVGGQGSSQGPYFDDVWSWDGERWQEVGIAGARPPGRAAGTLHATKDGELLYVGGYNTGLLGEMWAIGPSGWRKVAPIPD